jgi:hypothetical protein
MPDGGRRILISPWFFNKASPKDRAIAWGILVIPLFTLFILGMMLLRREPMEQRIIWGCYVADGAPALKVERDFIRILDGSGRSLRYSVMPQKDGYSMLVEPALMLVPAAEGRLEFRADQGTGYFWALLPKASNYGRRMRSPDDFGGGFVLVTQGNDNVVYVRTIIGSSCI